MGIVLTLILVVAVPVIISSFLEDPIRDLVSDTVGDGVIGLSAGAIGGIVMFLVLVVFMLLFGGGKILKKYGVIGIIGLILAYVFILDQLWGWVVPVAIVILLGLFSHIRGKKK